MPNFKPKAKKKICINLKTNITLDIKHNEKMLEFKNIQENIIPNLRKKRKKIKECLKNKNLSIEEKLNIKDEIKCIKNKIRQLKTKKNKYLLENSKIIFSYFENKKKLSEGKNQEKKKVLYNFFDNEWK